MFGCGLVGAWCGWCEGLCGWVGVRVVVSDAHARASFRVFVLLSWFCLFVLLITLPGRVGLVWCGVRGVFWVCVVIGLLSLLLVKVCVCGRLCVCEGCECSACLLV